MFIILEGCSLTGKSTLLSAVLNTIDTRTRGWAALRTPHHGQPSELTRRWALEQYVTEYEDINVLDSRTTVVADRWHYGERIYAPIYRPETNKDGYGLLGRAGWHWVEMFLRSRGAVVVAVRAKPSTVIARLAERGDDHVRNPDELLQVLAGYSMTWADGIGHTGIEYFSDRSESSDSAAQRIVNRAAVLRDKARRIEMFPEYIGNLTPTTLLVGDDSTAESDLDTVLPFAPMPGSLGDTLLSEASLTFLQNGGLVNAERLGADAFKELYRALETVLHVVVVGDKAAAIVGSAGITHHTLDAVGGSL